MLTHTCRLQLAQARLRLLKKKKAEEDAKAKAEQQEIARKLARLADESRAAALRSARDKSAKRESRNHDDDQHASQANISRSKSPHSSQVSQQRAGKSPSRLAGSKTTIFPPNSGSLPSQDKDELKKWMLKVSGVPRVMSLFVIHFICFFLVASQAVD